ncbi:phosphatase PAP2 family protein [Liquorilactobacillus mali]|uniref:phosphatase PAP2 family protein n=1 Tax=Liquorilactobacillus mali TaxID=1618 RepID=UPI002656F8D4|nr:phosphatase PAP2 family protein [Liquorilactobacillus mali]MDN7144967.1 phosphatase PAP2 family protein [Liquorilactobacillus mali]
MRGVFQITKERNDNVGEKEIKRWLVPTSSLVVFVGMMILVKLNNSMILHVDYEVLDWMTYLQKKDIIDSFHMLARIFSPVLVIIYMSVLMFPLLREKITLPLLEVTTGYILMEFIKNYVARPRPTDMLVRAFGYSFPSAHTFEIVLVSLVMLQVAKQLIYNKKLLYLTYVTLLLVMALVIFSRLYLQVHFFFGCDSWGILSVELAWNLGKRYRKINKETA